MNPNTSKPEIMDVEQHHEIDTNNGENGNPFLCELFRDCMIKVVSYLNWDEYDNLCKTNRTFEGSIHGMRNTILTLNKLEPCKVERFFPNVQRAIIKSMWSPEYDLHAQKYTKLTKLRTLDITQVNKPITFIKTTKLKELRVKAHHQAIVIDFISEILTKQKGLELLDYHNGVLGKESIEALSLNPIKHLRLYNVAIGNQNAFIRFLNNNENLKTIKLMGYKNKFAQQSILFVYFVHRNKIEELELTIQPRLMSYYHRLEEFKSLKRIIIRVMNKIFFPPIFEYIKELPNLKYIQLLSDIDSNYDLSGCINKCKENNILLEINPKTSQNLTNNS